MMCSSDERGGRGSSSDVVDASGTTRALVVPANNKNGNNENVDLSLWVVGYGESSRRYRLPPPPDSLFLPL
jgi:hypothetical protein